MSDVLVQSVLERPDGRRSGYRIFGDGRYETFDGEWHAEPPLDDARVAAVRRALAAVPLDDLAGRYEADTGETEPNTLWFQVGERTVSVVGGRRVPELERLTALLTDAFR